MLKQKLSQKTKLSQTLRSWLPILQANIEELKENLEEFTQDNPFVSIKEKIITQDKKNKNFYDSFYKNSISDTIEATSIGKKSVYELLDEQILPPLFPTKRSQDIAYKIIECLNNEGYFEYDKEILKDYKEDEVQKIRQRFKFLEPVGVGAVDYKEAFEFALENEELDDELYDFCIMLVRNFENIKEYVKSPLYKKALSFIKKITIPPFIEYFDDSTQITPDIYIYRDDNEIRVRINDEYYPEISLETDSMDHEFLNSYIKEAKNLVDALEMRKATLYKIGLMIVEYQYDFFLGKDIKPMRLQDLAQDLQRNASTISRAIANKYIACERGIIPLKNFFSVALDEDGETSNAAIKEYISALIKNENKKKPLSDEKLLSLAQKEFSNIQIGRRTIAKYRQQLKIANSSERKKLYELL